MRLRRSRTETYYHKKRIVEKDREGSTRESYGTASSVEGESWPASGKVQAQQYGERLNYIRNVRISGKYEVKPDEKGRMHYILENGTDIQESDQRLQSKADLTVKMISPLGPLYPGMPRLRWPIQENGLRAKRLLSRLA